VELLLLGIAESDNLTGQLPEGRQHTPKGAIPLVFICSLTTLLFAIVPAPAAVNDLTFGRPVTLEVTPRRTD